MKLKLLFPLAVLSNLLFAATIEAKEVPGFAMFIDKTEKGQALRVIPKRNFAKGTITVSSGGELVHLVKKMAFTGAGAYDPLVLPIVASDMKAKVSYQALTPEGIRYEMDFELTPADITTPEALAELEKQRPKRRVPRTIPMPSNSEPTSANNALASNNAQKPRPNSQAVPVAPVPVTKPTAKPTAKPTSKPAAKPVAKPPAEKQAQIAAKTTPPKVASPATAAPKTKPTQVASAAPQPTVPGRMSGQTVTTPPKASAQPQPVAAKPVNRTPFNYSNSNRSYQSAAEQQQNDGLDFIVPMYETLDMRAGELVVDCLEPMRMISVIGTNFDGAPITGEVRNGACKGETKLYFPTRLGGSIVHGLNIVAVDQNGAQHKLHVKSEIQRIKVRELSYVEEASFSTGSLLAAASAISDQIAQIMSSRNDDAPPLNLYIVRKGGSTENANYEIGQFVKALAKVGVDIQIYYSTVDSKEPSYLRRGSSSVHDPFAMYDGGSEKSQGETVVFLGTNAPQQVGNSRIFNWNEL